jgi:hypothetical protein
MEMFDSRFKFWDLAVAPCFGQFSSNQIDNQWARQVIFAQRVENLVDSRNLPA